MESTVQKAIRAARNFSQQDENLTPVWDRQTDDWFSSEPEATAHEAIIDRAYRDFCRTLHGWGHVDRAHRDDVLGQSAEILKDAFEELLKGNRCKQRAKFDQWHQKTCDRLCRCWKRYFHLHVGQAQKWINVGLKYHCIAGTRSPFGKVREYQQVLHVPLDNVVYLGLSEAADVEFAGTTLADWFVQSQFPAWSRFDDYPTYLKLQDGLRAVADAHNVTPIGIELFQWAADRTRL